MKMLLALVMFIALSSISFAQQSVDITQLLKRMTAMAQSGDAEAAYHLGMFYNNGIGVEQDYEEALRWFSISANKNDPLGAHELGSFYAGQAGDIVEADPEKAFRHKMTAAHAGYALAQYEVALMYLNFGNAKQGLKLLHKAAAQGHAQAYQVIAILNYRGDLLPIDLVEARSFLKLFNKTLKAEERQQLREIISQMEGQMSPDQVLLSDEKANNWTIQKTDLTIKATLGLAGSFEHAGMTLSNN